MFIEWVLVRVAASLLQGKVTVDVCKLLHFNTENVTLTLHLIMYLNLLFTCKYALVTFLVMTHSLKTKVAIRSTCSKT